jgi:Zn-dependent protease with chaperone function
MLLIILAIVSFTFWIILFPPPITQFLESYDFSQISPDYSPNTSTGSENVLFLGISWTIWLVFMCFFVGIIFLIFYSPNLILKKRKTIPIKEGPIWEIVDNLSKKLELNQKPIILLEQTQKSICFVFGTIFRKTRLLLSTCLIETMKEEELNAIILHELSHIKNKDVSLGTWGDYLKRALKYFALIVLLLGFFDCLLLFIINQQLDFSTIFSRFTFLVPYGFIPYIIINSGLKNRELLADARVLVTINEYGKHLKSAMIIVNVMNLKEEMNSSKKVSRNRRSFVEKIEQIKFHLCTPSYPTIKERIQAINNESYITIKNKIKEPPINVLFATASLTVYTFMSSIISVTLPILLIVIFSNSDKFLLALFSLVGVFITFIVPCFIIFITIYTYQIKPLNNQSLTLMRSKDVCIYLFKVFKSFLIIYLTIGILCIFMADVSTFNLDKIGSVFGIAYIFIATSGILSCLIILKKITSYHMFKKKHR